MNRSKILSKLFGRDIFIHPYAKYVFVLGSIFCSFLFPLGIGSKFDIELYITSVVIFGVTLSSLIKVKKEG